MQWLLSRRTLRAALTAILLTAGGTGAAAQVAVRHAEGLVRGFLVLRTLEGETLAGGDLAQESRGDRVTSRMVFHFKDGSIHDEIVVYTQRRFFRLLSYHLVQKGPAFRVPMDVSIDGPRGRVAIRYTDEDGKEKVETEQKPLPADIANGMTLTLVKNIAPEAQETIVSMVAPTPKPRLVKLKITRLGQQPFSAAGPRYEAIHYLVKVEIGGITGMLATLLGKNPPDHHVWIVRGEVPGFVRAEGPLFLGGPSWRIELATPTWP
jgi:hypothetical protein